MQADSGSPYNHTVAIVKRLDAIADEYWDIDRSEIAPGHWDGNACHSPLIGFRLEWWGHPKAGCLVCRDECVRDKRSNPP
jgi:hypothetical protein